MQHLRQSLTAYYAACAPQYDRIYDRPERQNDIRRLRELLTELLAGRRVLELACGSGYWTQHIAQVARSLLAIDSSEELLKLAAVRLRGFSNTALLIDDAFSLANIEGTFDAGFAAFWWSHIPKLHLPAFLDALAAKLQPGALIIFADHRFVEGSSTPLCRTDDEGNTYEQHRLGDNSLHEVLMNYPTRQEIEELIRPRCRLMSFHELNFYWCLSYQLPR